MLQLYVSSKQSKQERATRVCAPRAPRIIWSQAHEAVIKLRDNLRAEQHVVLEFAIAVFRGVFLPKQMATLLVKCYPAVPDALGIASALAMDLGEPNTPSAQQLAMQLGGYLGGWVGGGSAQCARMGALYCV